MNKNPVWIYHTNAHGMLDSKTYAALLNPDNGDQGRRGMQHNMERTRIDR